MKSLFLFATILIPFFLFSQKFEGQIDLVKHSVSDTTYLKYSIKGDQIRVDEYDKYKRLQRYFIVNVIDRSVLAVNPLKKMYTSISPKNITDLKNDKDFQVIKSNNYQMINGYKCFQWRVKNINQNTEISYWVAEDNFSFFSSLIKTWDNSDKAQDFYLLIPDVEGRMPMLMVERTLVRDEKNRIAVTNINKLKIDDSLFVVPKTYKQLNKGRE